MFGGAQPVMQETAPNSTPAPSAVPSPREMTGAQNGQQTQQSSQSEKTESKEASEAASPDAERYSGAGEVSGRRSKAGEKGSR